MPQRPVARISWTAAAIPGPIPGSPRSASEPPRATSSPMSSDSPSIVSAARRNARMRNGLARCCSRTWAASRRRAVMASFCRAAGPALGARMAAGASPSGRDAARSAAPPPSGGDSRRFPVRTGGHRRSAHHRRRDLGARPCRPAPTRPALRVRDPGEPAVVSGALLRWALGGIDAYVSHYDSSHRPRRTTCKATATPVAVISAPERHGLQAPGCCRSPPGSNGRRGVDATPGSRRPQLTSVIDRVRVPFPAISARHRDAARLWQERCSARARIREGESTL